MVGVTEFENGMNRTEKCGTGASLLGVRIPPSPPMSRATNCSHYIFCFDLTSYHIQPHKNFWISINRLGFRVLIETLLVASVGDRARMQKSIDQTKGHGGR
jgi:hypothetical protein